MPGVQFSRRSNESCTHCWMERLERELHTLLDGKTASMNSSQNTNFMTTPIVQVSWGELIDKMTILEIKEQRLTSPEAVANVRRELATLVSVAHDILLQRPDLASIKKQLRSVNEALWDIEDKMRAKEAAKSFDQQFVDLARSVYLNNDKRGNLKRQINALLDSELVEEKQYTPYST
jgi:uncharacterized protein DUF6165